MYRMADQYKQPPSELFGLEHPVVAFQFDQTLMLFGRQVDNKLEVKENRGTSKKPRWVPKYTLKSAINEVLRAGKKQPKGIGAQLLDGLELE